MRSALSWHESMPKKPDLAAVPRASCGKKLRQYGLLDEFNLSYAASNWPENSDR
jgi:hypothetical protein